MKSRIEFLLNKLGIESGRTKNITKHVVISFLYKGGNIVVSFLLVPLTIHLLETENYGIWLTLSSFISWFSFFDIGLGNGLRNKFAEAKAKGDLSLAKAYISTAYYTIGTLCLILIVFFFTLNFFIDWTRLFNANSGLKNDLRVLMPIVFSFFCLQLVLKLITTIYTADQHHSMQGKVTFYGSALSLITIWLMSQIGENSLLIFGALYSALPVMILLGLNIFAFSGIYKAIKPSIKFYGRKYLKDIFGLGMKFFFIQISGIILFSTDNILITHLFGPKEVVPFNIVYKYFSISNMALSMILAPYWSTITEAYTKNDINWIESSMKNLFKISYGMILLVILMMLISSIIYTYWIGDIITIPFSLNVVMAIFFSLTLYYSPYTYFINGIGKIKLQMYSIGLTSILNIPLSIFFAKNLELGVSGIIFATIVCLIPHCIFCSVQYSKIINKRAFGIWND